MVFIPRGLIFLVEKEDEVEVEVEVWFVSRQKDKKNQPQQ